MMCKTFDVVELSTQLEGLVAYSKLTKLFYVTTYTDLESDSCNNLTGLFPPTIDNLS